EMSFLPAIRLFAELAVRIIDVNRDFRLLHFGAHPEPILVPLEELLPNRLFLAYPEVAAPIIFTHLKSLFHIGLSSLERERVRVIHRSERDRQTKAQSDQPQGGASNRP